MSSTRPVTMTKQVAVEIARMLPQIVSARYAEVKADPMKAAGLLAQRFQGFTLTFNEHGDLDSRSLVETIAQEELDLLLNRYGNPDITVLYAISEELGKDPEIIVYGVQGLLPVDYLKE